MLTEWDERRTIPIVSRWLAIAGDKGPHGDFADEQTLIMRLEVEGAE
jgi:hypothetical protein